MIKLSVHDNAKAKRYANRWFWTRDQIVEAAMIDHKALDLMFKHNCVPGAIYQFSDQHGWWSALSDTVEKGDSAMNFGQNIWYSPAIIWWLRRTLLSVAQGLSIEQAGLANKQMFVEKFVNVLRQMPDAKIAYPSCYDSDTKVIAAIAWSTASDEWGVWIDGAYAVCLRDFSATNCIRKETIGSTIKAHFNKSDSLNLTDHQLLSLCQELSTLVTPFAPWERQSGTPGKTIDVALRYFGMGQDHPYPFF